MVLLLLLPRQQGEGALFVETFMLPGKAPSGSCASSVDPEDDVQVVNPFNLWVDVGLSLDCID